jgi:hypothetical protein
LAKKNFAERYCAFKSLKLIDHEYFEKYKIQKLDIPQKP